MSPLLHHGACTLRELFANAAPLAAGALISAIWRGLLLALVVAAILRLLPRLSAAVRSAIWLFVLLALVALPFSSLVPPTANGPTAHSAFHVDQRWSYVLLAVWISCSFLWLLQLAASAWQLRQLAVRSVPLASGKGMQRLLGRSSRRVRLCVSADVDRPSVVGFFRPRILIPLDLLSNVSETDLEQIVLHELEHLRRHDDWTNLLQKLSLALMPLHPVVFWLDRRLCVERELACDDGVLQATESRKSYAACLTNLAERSLFRRGLSLALGAVGTVGMWKPRSEIAKRVCRILTAPQASMSPLQSRVAAGTLLAGVLTGALALAHTPHLVSFTPDASTAIATTASSVPVLSFAIANPQRSASTMAPHATLAMEIAGPHASFAKAITMPRATNNMPRATNAALHITAHKPVLKRLQQQRRIAQAAQPSLPLSLAPAFRLAAWQDSEFPSPRFALAIQQDPQFTYAAVPVRGGWLIFQI